MEWGDVWGNGVEGQRQMRGEAMDIGVGEWHVAHIVVRESVILVEDGSGFRV